MDLVGAVALPLAGQGVLGILLGRAHVRVGAGIGLDLLPASAQQLVNRHAVRASLQVPQSHVDRAEQVLRYFGHPHPVPEPLAIERVVAHQQRFGPAHERRPLVRGQAIAIPVPVPTKVVALGALVGEDLDQSLHRRPFRQQLAVAKVLPRHTKWDHPHVHNLHDTLRKILSADWRGRTRSLLLPPTRADASHPSCSGSA
jgi:hypothetical protein